MHIALLNEIRTTLYQQTLSAEFESWMYEAIRFRGAKGDINAEELNTKYFELMLKYYQYSIHMAIDNEVMLEWCRGIYFQHKFCVFQYPIQISVAISLAKKVIAQEGEASEKYLEFLKSGGSRSSLELLDIAGIDVRTSEPVMDAIDLFSKLTIELRELLKREP